MTKETESEVRAAIQNVSEIEDVVIEAIDESKAEEPKKADEPKKEEAPKSAAPAAAATAAAPAAKQDASKAREKESQWLAVQSVWILRSLTAL